MDHREALERIAAIENQMFGPDWEEIDQAREIARVALEQGPAALPTQVAALIANLAAVVRVQNGNRHEDVNALLRHADEVLDAHQAAVGETTGEPNGS